MTKPTAYYNEIDPAAAHILRAMIAANVILLGDVDTRSIKEVQPDDLKGYTQCHFFAGGGLWSVAARLAGWPDDQPLWTGSCPCQPFSAAGKGLGTDDPRHLWPDFHRLIRASRPSVVMGEQVAGKAGYGWFDGVRADLAREDYAGRAVDFPACSIDAPHQRNRLYWIALAHAQDSGYSSTDQRSPNRFADADGALGNDARVGCAEAVRESRDNEAQDRRGPAGRFERSYGGNGGPSSNSTFSLLQGQSPTGHEPNAGTDESVYADANGHRCDRPWLSARQDWERLPHGARHPQRNGTYWSDAGWIACHDGKARRAQSGIRFLVDGLPGRVDLWRVGGNAIVPEAAAEVIAAFLDAEADERLRLTGVFA